MSKHHKTLLNHAETVSNDADGVFAYQLIVVDDADMGVTEVVRIRSSFIYSQTALFAKAMLGFLSSPSIASLTGCTWWQEVFLNAITI